MVVIILKNHQFVNKKLKLTCFKAKQISNYVSAIIAAIATRCQAVLIVFSQVLLKNITSLKI